MHPYKKLMKYFRPYLWILAVSILFSFAVNIGHLGRLSAIIPAVNKILTRTDIIFADGVKIPHFLATLVEKINSMPSIKLLYVLIIWLPLVEIIRGISSFFASFFLNMASEKLMKDLRNEVYEKLLKLSMSFYSKSSTGRLVSKITYDTTVLKNSITQGLMDIVKEPLTLIANIGMVIFCKIFFPIPWKLIIVSLATFLVIIFPVMAIGRKLRKIAKQGLDKMGDINRVLYETISGIRIVKAFSMERYESAKFNKENTQFYKITMKSIKRMLALSPITEFVGVVSVALILWFVRHDLSSGSFPFGAFAALAVALTSLMKPIKKLSQLYGIHQQAMASASNVFELIDAEVSVKEKSDASNLKPFTDRISFEGAKFSYEEEIVLKDINLDIKKGQIIAVVGPSGVGKTTLVNLLPRFYDVTGGAIKVDGVDVRDVTLDSLWGQIGLVTQETILFNDTVLANIAYGQADKTKEESVVNAAKVANAHEFISKLPDGYKTVIGERGFRLSGGQKQRLAIARAVFKDPPILILDEATSQLDTESEKLVQAALDRLMKGRTTLVIAHRLSTIKNANKIIVLENGHIVEEGSHEKLLKQAGLYKKLHDMQFKE